MLIERPPKWFRRLFPGAVFRLPSTINGKKRIFLTFDDGPIPEATPTVLDILDDYGVKATFFMVGENVRRHPQLLEDIIRRGHATGNHTLHHMKDRDGNPAEYLRDSREGARLSGSLLFRPPHGWISSAKLKVIRNHYHVVMYDLVTRDYNPRLSAADIVNNVKKFSRDGSIIVFHDSLKSFPRLLSALPESIEWLLAEGYEFQVLTSELLRPFSRNR